MRIRFLFLVLTFFVSLPLIAQNNSNISAALEIDTTTKGFLPPRMSTVQRDVLSSPATGLIIYNIDTFTLNVYSGASWVQVGSTVNGANPITSSTGKVWMDRNLGASRVASSSTDSDAYGDLYQWGRNSDGHQLRTSGSASGPVASGSEGSNFITSFSSPVDWLSTQDITRWNGSNKGVHDPCPSGFRIPTEVELNDERINFTTFNSAGAFASVLKLPAAGYRAPSSAALTYVGSYGYYWSSTVAGSSSRALAFNNNDAVMYSNSRARAFSIRCIKE